MSLKDIMIFRRFVPKRARFDAVIRVFLNHSVNNTRQPYNLIKTIGENNGRQ